MTTETETQLTEEPPSSQNWKWQLQHSITTKEELEKHLTLIKEENDYFDSEHSNHIKFKITPYYMDLVKKFPILRKTVIPQIHGLTVSKYESNDFLKEDEYIVLPNLIHKYPDRVLFLISNQCAVNCQYCTRSRLIDKDIDIDIEKSLQYIKEHKEVRDIILSGGDSLLISNEKLNYILSELYKIKTIEVIRLGTKIIVTNPYRIDKDLLKILKKYRNKLWINIHFTHPLEITKEVKRVCLKLSNIGITLGSQTVLLKNVNSDIKTMKKLMQKLLTIKVTPRYIYMCDRNIGTEYFRTSIEESIQIMRGIQGFTSGMACPKLIVDTELGKIPIDLGYTIEETNEYYIFKNYESKEIKYFK
jgi:lysine 2,3-aminomutase